ncbi:MAG: (d)CMP kinase [Rhodospirillales bacterium]|nr:(d)CMP kinase [Rhodospirillales bacterium]
MTQTPFVIAIDGPAASGKGTIAKRLAADLDFAFMDTGALYRLTGWDVLQTGGDPGVEEDALASALWLQEHFTPEMTEDPDIRNAAAGNAASQVGFFPAVRQALYDLQMEFAAHPPGGKKGAVLDGRDIGTVICPHAAVKLYVTASTEVRAERRTKELQGKGFPVSYDEILADMKIRDARDSERAAAPLKPADDAVILDTTTLTAEEAFVQAYEVARERLYFFTRG